MTIKKLNIGTYNRMSTFGKIDIIDLYQQHYENNIFCKVQIAKQLSHFLG